MLDLAAAGEAPHAPNRPATRPTLLAWASHPVPPQAHFRPSRGAQHIISPDLARAYYGPCAAPPAACARPRAFNLELDLFNVTPYYRFKANYLYKGGWLLFLLLPPWWPGLLLEVALLGSIFGSMLHWVQAKAKAHAHCLSTPPSLPLPPTPPDADSPREKRPPGLGLWAVLEAPTVIPVRLAACLVTFCWQTGPCCTCCKGAAAGLEAERMSLHCCAAGAPLQVARGAAAQHARPHGVVQVGCWA